MIEKLSSLDADSIPTEEQIAKNVAGIAYVGEHAKSMHTSGSDLLLILSRHRHGEHRLR